MQFKKFDSIILLCVAIAALVTLLIFAPMLIHASKASEYDDESDQFIRVANGFNYTIDDTVVYDKDTKVMYVVNNKGYYWVLYNPDGTPRIYEKSEE